MNNMKDTKNTKANPSMASMDGVGDSRDDSRDDSRGLLDSLPSVLEVALAYIYLSARGENASRGAGERGEGGRGREGGGGCSDGRWGGAGDVGGAPCFSRALRSGRVPFIQTSYHRAPGWHFTVAQLCCGS